MREAHDHGRVSPEGRELGSHLVRLIEAPLLKLEAEGEPDERCKTCAFRTGTVPNGCVQTQLDALKCVMEQVPFMCHQNLNRVCYGWFTAKFALKGNPPTICPWEF